MMVAEVNAPVLTLGVGVFLAGLILIAASAGEALNFKIQIDPERKHNALIGGVLAILFGIALSIAAFMVGDGPSPNDDDASPSTSAASASTSAPPSTVATTLTTPPTQVTGCVITVSNPFATIHEEPDTFSQEVIRLPAGSYPVEEVRNTTFGPQRQRWFRVTANGRSGWLEDSTFNIASKSADCP